MTSDRCVGRLEIGNQREAVEVEETGAAGSHFKQVVLAHLCEGAVHVHACSNETTGAAMIADALVAFRRLDLVVTIVADPHAPHILLAPAPAGSG